MEKKHTCHSCPAVLPLVQYSFCHHAAQLPSYKLQQTICQVCQEEPYSYLLVDEGLSVLRGNVTPWRKQGIRDID